MATHLENGVAIARNKNTLIEHGRFPLDTEGWGLCALDDRLVLSDGSSTLTFRDPDTMTALSTVDVTRSDNPIDKVNELEYADDGYIYANVWTTDTIVRINPEDGDITNVYDASILRRHLDPDTLMHPGRRTQRIRTYTQHRSILTHRKTLATGVRHPIPQLNRTRKLVDAPTPNRITYDTTHQPSRTGLPHQRLRPQRFRASFSCISPHFRPPRHPMTATDIAPNSLPDYRCGSGHRTSARGLTDCSV